MCAWAQPVQAEHHVRRGLLRAFNLDVRQPEKAAQLKSGKSVALVWQAAIKAADTPWIAAVIPNGDLSQRQELTGTSP